MSVMTSYIIPAALAHQAWLTIGAGVGFYAGMILMAVVIASRDGR